MANRYFKNAGHFYANHVMPVLLNATFQVSVTDTAGNGVVNLTTNPGGNSSGAVQAVYMHTSATASAGNPNPGNGIIYVQFADAYNKDYLGWSGQITALSGSSILVASAGVVNHTTYVITILGTTTTAGWQSLGLPVGVTPAVGVAFIATTTGTAAGTGAVQVPHANGSGIQTMDQIGSSANALSPVGIGAAYPYLIFRCMGPTDASTTTPIAVAPRDLTWISLKFYFSNSSV